MKNGVPTNITIVQTDYGYDLAFTLEDFSGVPLDISAATLVFEAQSISDPTIVVSEPMTVLSGPAGTCKYTVQQNDFTVAGQYSVQIIVSFSVAEVVTFPNINLCVLARLPIS